MQQREAHGWVSALGGSEIQSGPAGRVIVWCFRGSRPSTLASSEETLREALLFGLAMPDLVRVGMFLHVCFLVCLFLCV